MKYLFLIVLFFGSCSNKKNQQCEFENCEDISFHKKVYISLPSSILKLQDTLSHNFEPDKNLRFIMLSMTMDSLSWVSCEVRENPLSNKRFLQYANDRLAYYKAMFNYSANNYVFQKIDTSNINPIFKVGFLGKKNNFNIAFGIIMIYIGAERYEILINLDEHNFDGLRDIMECILRSLRINKP